MNVIDLPSALAYLMARIDYERSPAARGSRDFKLDRMRFLLAELGNPQDALRVVHVAGTKGKGSTASMIASILRQSGLKTGLYTSPHLQCLTERYNVDGEQCTPQELAQLTAEVQPVVDEMDRRAAACGDEAQRPTYFEITTAIAFLYFARRGVDVVVLEVGLGGRLDSTNVCRPEVAVITSISFDHTRQLGDTLAEIAAEKAGIIKPGADVVSGVTGAEPAAVVERVAREKNCNLRRLGRDFDFDYRADSGAARLHAGGAGPFGAVLDFSIRGEHGPARLEGLSLRIAGRHQAANAAIAAAAAMCLRDRGWRISDGDIRQGLAAAKCPARAEILPGRPTVLIDTAHNVASVEALLGVLGEQFADRRRILVFASSRDKDVAGMLRLLLPGVDHVVLTQFCGNPRAAAAGDLADVCRELGLQDAGGERRFEVADNPRQAWRRAAEAAGPDDLICVAGSFFLAAEMRPLALGEAPAVVVPPLTAV